MASRRSRNARTATITVEIPEASSNRATCPTDTWQIGQTGTSSAASTCFRANIATHSGPASLRSGIWAVAPTKE